MGNDKGYIGIGLESGNFIPADKAYEYALERSLHGTEEEVAEFREMLVEWYFSGNWIKEDRE